MQGGRLERGLSSVELVTGVAFGAYCQARHGFGRTITWYGAAHLHSKTLYRKCSRRSGRCVLPSYSPCLNLFIELALHDVLGHLGREPRRLHSSHLRVPNAPASAITARHSRGLVVIVLGCASSPPQLCTCLEGLRHGIQIIRKK